MARQARLELVEQDAQLGVRVRRQREVDRIDDLGAGALHDDDRLIDHGVELVEAGEVRARDADAGAAQRIVGQRAIAAGSDLSGAAAVAASAPSRPAIAA